jgi:hypothetical protein
LSASATPGATPSRERVTIINPDAVIVDDRISKGARLLYVMLWRRINARGEVEIYMKDLAKMLGLSEDGVYLFVRELREHGVISTRRQGKFKPVRYALLTLAGVAAIAASAGTARAESAHQLTLIAPVKTQTSDGDSRYFRDSEADACGDGPDPDGDPADSVVPGSDDPETSRGQQAAATPLPSPTPPPHAPVREALSQQPAAAVRARDPGELLLLAGLKKYGIDHDAAVLLVTTWPDRCRWQLRAMPHRGGIKKPARFLRRAIERDFDLPDHVAGELRAALRVAAVPPESHSDVAMRRISDELDQRAIDELIGTLPTSMREQLQRDAQAEIDAHPLFSRAPNMVRDGMIRAAIVRMARELRATTR